MTVKNTIMINRLRQQMKIAGINARELSQKAKVGKSFVYDILSGKSTNPTTSKIQAVADALGIGLQELMGNSDAGEVEETVNDDYVLVSDLAVEGSMLINKQKKVKMSFKKDWIKNTLNTKTENIRAVRINGDYMEPTLMNGDVALVDISKRIPNPPGIYILYDGHGLVPKRLECIRKSGESLIFITPDNKNYESYKCKLQDTNIVGKIVWFSRAVC